MFCMIEKEKVILKKLIYAQDTFHKNLIIETLEQKGIAVISKPTDLSSVLGYSIHGEELYVREMDYEQAFEILQELETQEVDFDELEKLAVSYAVEDGENDNSLYEQIEKKYVKKFVSIVAIALVLGVFCKYSNPAIEWHDETLEWIVAQELNKNPEDSIRISDVSKITELHLDAEEIKDLSDLKYFYNLRVLELKTVSVDNLSPIKNLKHLEKLVLSGLDIKTLDSLKRLHLSDITLQNLPLLSIDSLVHLEKLQKLKLQGIPVPSIQIIAAAKNLEMLDLEDMDINDLEVLKDLPNLSSISIKRVKMPYAISLNELGRYQNVSLSDMEVEGQIDSQYIKTLSLEYIDLEDRTDCLKADDLKSLTLNHCGLKDLTLLHNLTKLESLSVAENEIQNIDSLEDFTELKSLSLEDNPIVDLSPISTLRNIEKLDLSGIDFRGQENLISKMSLRELRLSNSNLMDIYFLETQKELKWLDISENKIKDIEPLRIYREGLSYLDISGNPISELTPLSEWVVLEPRRLEEGTVLNISGIHLGDMEKEHLKFLNLKKLYARNCGINDLDFLHSYENLQYLDISNNHIKYLSDFVGMLKLQYLREVNAKGNSITGDYLLYGIKRKAMKANAIHLSPGVYGCPVDWKNFYIMGENYKNTWLRIIID